MFQELKEEIPGSVATADLNEDGWEDLLFTRVGGAPQIFCGSKTGVATFVRTDG